MIKWRFKVTGMMCTHCSTAVEQAIRALGAECHINLSSNLATVRYEEPLQESDIIKAVEETGYGVVRIEDKKKDRFLIEVIIGLILAFPLLYAHLGHFDFMAPIVPGFLHNGWVLASFATLLQFAIGWRFYRRAWYDLKSRSLGMDVLIVLGTSIAYFFSLYLLIAKGQIGYFECSGVVIAIVNLAHYLQERVKKKTGAVLEELMKLQVKDAWKVEGDQVVLVPASSLQIGDIIEVKMQETIPIDGTLCGSVAFLDESILSGESRPVEKQRDDSVFGGTLNVGEIIRLKVSVAYESTMLAGMIEAVEKATEAKPPMQKISDRVAHFFVPTVLLLALACFLLNYFVILKTDGERLEEAAIRAISVLVISCPCALGLAVPMSVMVGYGTSAKQGILFKSGEMFERLKKIDAVCFDKTGTLSEGQFRVHDYRGAESYLAILLALEKGSSHPLALSICESFKEITPVSLTSMKLLPGVGVEGRYQNHHYRVSKAKGDFPDFLSFISKEEERLSEVVALYEDEKMVLVLALNDQMKATAVEAVKELQNAGMEVYLISGDRHDIAASFAHQVGIKDDHVYAEVIPSQKAEVITQIQAQGRQVAFVGDGVNDALALETADLGMAMAKGSSVAILSSDVTLLDEDMRSVARAIRIARRIYRNIYGNFAWALVYNLVMIPLAFLGYVSPVVSALCMALSDLIVVFNALRLKRKER